METPMNFREIEKTWIVAEIGVNHEGNESVAADLIQKASDCGVDAVKFQTYEADYYISTVQPERRDRVSKFELSREAFVRLSNIAKDCGITFFSTPLSFNDIDFLDEIIPLFKVSSGDITYIDLIRYIAQKNKPMIISTGSSTREEIQTAVDTVLSVQPDARESGKLMLMHCVSAYPTPPKETNLANIKWLNDNFNLPTGYSDHTLGIKACELAIAAGAIALEKHFTYQKENQAFHDHALSADPEDLKQLVQSVRTAEQYIGNYSRKRMPSEEKILSNMRRSIAAAVDISKDVPVKKEWLTFLRPAWGLPPDQLNEVLGKPLKRNKLKGDLKKAEDI